MLLKSCAKCRKLIQYGKPYCKECQAIVDEAREKRRLEQKRKANRDYNKRRDPKYIRFYNSSDWKILSARYAQDKGYRCEKCGAIATQVHHVEAIQKEGGWERRLDYHNLELLCLSCHNERHNRFQKKKK